MDGGGISALRAGLEPDRLMPTSAGEMLDDHQLPRAPAEDRSRIVARLRDTHPRNPAATTEIWLYSAVAEITVVPESGLRDAKIVPAVVPTPIDRLRKIASAGTSGVSDGTRTRGRRDHNPRNPGASSRIPPAQAISVALS